jgi:PAS domain S-box-containing protein
VAFALDREGRITAWGPGAEAFFGRSAAEALGQRVQTFYAPEQRLGQLMGKRQALPEEQPTEWKFVAPSGRPLWLKVRALPLRDADGRREGWLVTGTDITQWKQTERHAVQLAVINQLSRQMNASHNPAQIARAVAEALHRRLGYSHAAVLWLDAATQALVLAAIEGDAGDVPGDYRQRLDRGILGRVAHTGQAEAIGDTRLESDYVPPGVRRLSELCVPIRHNGRVLGVINLEADEVNAFDPLDVEAVQTIADGLAVALENAQLLDDVSAQAERLRVLSALDQAISRGSLDLRQLFDTFAEQAGRLLRYDRMSLALAEGDQFYILGIEPTLKASLGREMWLPRGGTSFDWAMEHNQMLVRPDMTQPPHFAHDEIALQAGIRMSVVVPLHARGKALGTWNLSRREPDAFSPAEIETFQMVAEQLAIGVYNVQLHQDLAERALRLQRAYMQLEEVNRLKDQMIQNISHELRLPLTVVRGYLELMLDGTLGAVPSGWEEHLETSIRRTEDIVRIVERITTLHGLRVSGLEMQPVALCEWMHQAIETWRTAAEAACLTIQLEVPHEEQAGLTVHGDAARLAQVMDSLLDNAIKFNRPDGQIRVRATNGDDLITVEVTDTGIGIPADKLDRVWDTFYQVDGSTTRRYGGMGVGLALVKDVIEAHGGAVWARSVEGQGSTFGFALRKAAKAPRLQRRIEAGLTLDFCRDTLAPPLNPTARASVFAGPDSARRLPLPLAPMSPCRHAAPTQRRMTMDGLREDQGICTLRS